MIRGLVSATNPPRRRPREISPGRTGFTAADIGTRDYGSGNQPNKAAPGGTDSWLAVAWVAMKVGSRRADPSRQSRQSLAGRGEPGRCRRERSG